jgi:hypothetical protein
VYARTCALEPYRCKNAHGRLCAQKLKLRRIALSHAVAVCGMLKAMSRLGAVDRYPISDEGRESRLCDQALCHEGVYFNNRGGRG